MANPNIVAVTNILGGNLGWNLSATASKKKILISKIIRQIHLSISYKRRF